MAIPAFKGTITFRDSEGNLSTMTLWSGAASHAAAVSEITGISGLIDGVLTDAVIAQVEVSQIVSVSGETPSGNVDNEIKALFTFNNVDGKAYQTSIPAFKRNLLNAGSDTVNVAHTDVVDFIAAMIGGTVRDSRDVDLSSLRSAVEHYTRRQR